MVGQQQGPNQIESPANLLQQPHNYDVQVRRFVLHLEKVYIYIFIGQKRCLKESPFNSYPNKICTKFVLNKY